MNSSQEAVNSTALAQHGLNRHAIFNIDALPDDVGDALHPYLADFPNARQLILIGHAGTRLWEAVQAAEMVSEHPIDDFTVHTVQQWFADHYRQNRYQIIYPGPQAIGLQRLGQLAGWHHASPFMVGIDAEWGSWFAYRAVLLADTAFAPTPTASGASPCTTCLPRTCVANCPGGALGTEKFNLGNCVAYRKEANSQCKDTCLARVSCPVGASHRYSEAQLRHTYSRSLRMIEQYY